ncbi:hypothetical protein GDO86_006884 [Hymenochirus boettgeri]|nr:hypothetical protein GDO86_006884 [Hymenochirus boettgeri]
MSRGGKVFHKEKFDKDPRQNKTTVTVTQPITVQRNDNQQEFSCQANFNAGKIHYNLESSVIAKTISLPERPKLLTRQWIQADTYEEAKCVISNGFPPENLILTIELNNVSLPVIRNPAADGTVEVSAIIPTNTSLSIDPYKLICRAVIQALSRETNIDIHIYEYPKINFTLSNTSAIVGETVTASCVITNTEPKAYRTQIMLDGQRVCEGSEEECNVTISTRSPLGVFACESSLHNNKNITVTEQEFITVYYAPEFRSDLCPDPYEILEGNNKVFTCSFDGNPSPIVFCNSTDRLALHNNRSYDIDRTLTGLYQCYASNNYGEATKLILVEVQYPPGTLNITAVPSGNIAKGDAVNLTCTSDGFPSPKVQWIVPSGKTVYEDTIFIQRASSSDNGIYKCKSENKHGVINESQHINVSDMSLVIILLIVCSLVFLGIIAIAVWYTKWRNGRIGFYNMRPKQTQPPRDDEIPMNNGPCNER